MASTPTKLCTLTQVRGSVFACPSVAAPVPLAKLTLPHPILAGAIATGIVVGRKTLRLAAMAGTQLVSVTVDRVEIDFPSLSRPLAIRIKGVRVGMQQMHLPEVGTSLQFNN